MQNGDTTQEKMQRAPFLDDVLPSRWSSDARPHWTSKRLCGVPVLFLAAGAAAALLLFWFAAPTSVTAPLHITAGLDANYLPGPMNATLGFGAILLLTLPDRTDRQDALTLITSNTGLEITKTIYSVRGEDISHKAMPFGDPSVFGKPIPKGYLGSWRTHMNALRWIVDNRIETALLLEDDVDWSVAPRSVHFLKVSFSPGC